MIWLALALVIVAAAAALLIWIVLEARGILGHAVRALQAGEKIETSTRILRAIPDVNTMLDQTNNSVAAIAASAGALASALAGPPQPRTGSE